MNRFDRQERVHQIGIGGQKKISQATILIVGVGALGSYSAEQVVRAGVKKLILVDPDTVSYTNLQRQTLFTEEDAKLQRLKVEAAKDHLEKINSACQITAIPSPLTADIIDELSFTLCLDCLDNYRTRDLLNKLALTTKFDYIFASCAGTYGNVMAISPLKGPCLNCLFPNIEKLKQTDCDLIGVNTALVPLVSSLQVSLALRYLINKTEVNFHELITVDNWSMQFNKFQIKKASTCPSCQVAQPHFKLEEEKSNLQMLCGENAYYTVIDEEPNMQKLQQFLRQKDCLLSANRLFIHFKWRDLPVSIFKNGKIIMYDLPDVAAAQRQLLLITKLLKEA
ncbi:HesA/MoeB/ThiF family protein [Limosilactobacillus sp. STM2_1]|uniref:HesA/MoeB/ThiF family protein n=1 Tax=Limosilactobacillus rudii TaxID=2759755 RepID=A0A7W3YNK1_9LACO|nr:HesA/MoeB/ThiF family protein [Limosilactobacillus rudii]MBB1078886.1 HesA/MoeB/ThiF family protein [Limosilactobacillus rudii]MBB1098238.1 HesA/MoeB/ThiF family protein [Limosilactobacillus rudii]MCD7135647.1 HesA/MoeB/ThiF family protein [Limosilactobacillus rudii]